ncbi:MAG: hypothetical protein AAFR76_01415 [Planctomycetota bacterium]
MSEFNPRPGEVWRHRHSGNSHTVAATPHLRDSQYGWIPAVRYTDADGVERVWAETDFVKAFDLVDAEMRTHLALLGTRWQHKGSQHSYHVHNVTRSHVELFSEETDMHYVISHDCLMQRFVRLKELEA